MRRSKFSSEKRRVSHALKLPPWRLTKPFILLPVVAQLGIKEKKSGKGEKKKDRRTTVEGETPTEEGYLVTEVEGKLKGEVDWQKGIEREGEKKGRVKRRKEIYP